MSWLKDFARRVPPGVSTAVVVETIIKPETASACCRYVAVIEEADPGAVGRASAFASHTWCAPFRDLVAALAHVLGDDGFVWIDIFAVLQWPTAEQAADLDFTQVVQATSVLVLVGTHVEAVARLDADDTLARRVPEQARKLCAFFRVWCLVELVAALRADKPVLLLVGSAVEGDALIFEPNAGMLGNLFLVLDVEKAAASVEADRVRILDAVRRGSGFDAVNSIARGAVVGAARCMWQRQVLQAAAGNPAPLAELRGGAALEPALSAAAAAGLLVPLEALLCRRDEVEVDGRDAAGQTALMLAANGGHAMAAKMLLAAGAAVDAYDREGFTALMLAAFGGHKAAVEVLVQNGAETNTSNHDGWTAASLAEDSGHEPVVQVLRETEST